MAELRNIIEFFQNIENILQKKVNEILGESEIQSKIEELNRTQLRRGQRGDGLYLPKYSPASVIYYGKPRGRIRLYDTGAFYQSITVLHDENEITIISTDEKWDGIVDLRGRYGDEVLGLMVQNWNGLVETEIIPKLVEYIEQKIKKI